MNEDNKANLNELPEHIQNNIKSEIDFLKLEKDIEKDLKTNPKYKEYFEKFSSSSVKNFIDSYKRKKAHVISYGEMYSRDEDARQLKYKELAENYLFYIQQKKLFNFQCEWRAELVTAPEIKITDDFKYWEDEIRNCNFIPAITEDEILLLKEFLIEGDFREDIEYFASWQDYDKFKENYNSDSEDDMLPLWYEFFDSRKGSGNLLTLPNTRGEKEDFYWKIYFDNQIKTGQEKIEKQKIEGTYIEPVIDNRPILNSFGDHLYEFVELFEEGKTKRYFKAEYDSSESRYELEDIEPYLEILLNADEPVTMEISDNWKDAIIKTAVKYENGKVSEVIDEVYGEYLQRISLGISYEKHESYHENISKGMMEQILKGRKLNGEPEDLNF